MTGMTTNQYTFKRDGQRVEIVDSQGTKKPIWDFEGRKGVRNEWHLNFGNFRCGKH